MILPKRAWETSIILCVLIPSILQVCTITADNASNMISAFSKTAESWKAAAVVGPLSCSESAEVEILQEKVGEEEHVSQIYEELEDIQDFVSQNEDPRGVEEDILEGVNNNPTRNSCLAHLLQLGVKDAIAGCDYVTNMIKKVNDIVTFFHRSSYFYGQLRKQNGDLALVKPCVTRWNSQYHCLKRLLVSKPGRVRAYTKTLEPTREWDLFQDYA